MEEIDVFLERRRKKKAASRRKKKTVKKMRPATVPYGTVPEKYHKQLSALRKQSSNGLVNVSRSRKKVKKMRPAMVPVEKLSPKDFRALKRLAESSRARVPSLDGYRHRNTNKHVVQLVLSDAEYKELKEKQAQNGCRKLETTIKLILFGRSRY